MIIPPHRCYFFCGDFSLGEAGAVSGAQRAADSADILEKMCYKQERGKSPGLVDREYVAIFVSGKPYQTQVWNPGVLLRGSQPLQHCRC